MKVCACGNPMPKEEVWCRICWAFWSSWYMRAGGRWFDAEGAWCTTDVRERSCTCVACTRHRDLTHGADVTEDRRLVLYRINRNG